ncbi:MAG: PduL/EutD family phosphate acyltransferase [Gemmatimonadaceae bacterium]
MTEQEIERLVTLVVDALLRRPADVRPDDAARAAAWLPIPVRPEPPARSTEPPVWSGAAQRLDDVAPTPGAPSRGPVGAASGSSVRRVATGELTNAVRAAAAGRTPAPAVAPVGRTRHRVTSRLRSLEIDVAIGVSNRHVHLSSQHARQLFAADQPTVLRPISQPGQFAANETVTVSGPRGKLDAVRVVGPARGETQLEISLSDAFRLGIAPPVAASGSLAESIGGVTLEGTSGQVSLTRGVIVAARHLHLASDDAARWGLADGDRLDVRVGQGARATTYHDVLVRAGGLYATELHLDADVAFAAGVKTGDRARIVSAVARAPQRPVLITERDVVRIAREGGSLPARALLTPSARDRARSLGLEP